MQTFALPSSSTTSCLFWRRGWFVLCGWLLLTCAGPVVAQTSPRPSLTAALNAIVVPDAKVVDALQKALDDCAWPTGPDAAPLAATLDVNVPAIEAFDLAVEQGVCDLPLEGKPLRQALTRLRLALALVLADGLRAVAEHRPDAVERDLRVVAAAVRTLVAAPATPLRIVGLSVVARMVALARRASCPVPAVSLPSVGDLATFEKAQYLAAAARAGESDRSLDPHIRSAAANLAATYFDPLIRPLSAFEAEALSDRFTALYSVLGGRYREMDPRQVTDMIPMPVPPAAELGKTVAEVVLCGRYLDTGLLLRVYGEAMKALRGQ